MISELVEALQYTFIQRALIAGCLIAVCCSFLGVFLVLRKLSMIGDGLSHAAFATVAFALLLNQSPLLVSIPLLMLASVAIYALNKKANLYGDAAIGMIAGTGIALGVLLASISGGFNVDLFSYLFGSILAVGKEELYAAMFLCAAVISVVALFYNELFSISYDEEFAEVNGIEVKRVNVLLMFTTSITIALGIRLVGTMLISSLIIFPAVTALQISSSFKKALILSASVAVFSVISGIFAAYLLDFPAGATIVLMNALLFIISFIIRRIKS
jgi:zinc transport system permease protein